MASNPSHGGVVALGFTIFLTVLSTLFILLRFWARKMTRFGLWWDDWLALATLVCLYAVLVLSCWAVYEGGIGKPIVQAVTEQPAAVTEVLKALYGFEFAYLFASPLMKLTVLAYYWRMFPSRSIKLGIWVLSAVCGAWFVCVLFGNLLECVPISHFWDLAGPGYCRFPATMYYVVVAIPNMVIDLLTVLLPIWEIWHLKLSLWKRIGVCAIFFLGGIVVVASIVRLALLVQFHNKGTANLTEDLLFPWFSTVVEIGVAIIGSCLPCLLPLYRRVRYGSPDTRNYGYGYGSKSGGSRSGGGAAGLAGPASSTSGTHNAVHSSKLASSNYSRPRGPGAFGKTDDHHLDDDYDCGGPFERLSTVHTKASAEDEVPFAQQPASSLSSNSYRAKASVGHASMVVRTHMAGSDSHIPLEGISVQHEIVVQRSTSKGAGSWLDDNRI